MSRLALLACLLLCFASGCGKSAKPPPTEAESTPVQPGTPAAPVEDEPAAAAAETDLPALLSGLTQAVRKYGAEKQQAPKTLEGLVAAGYLARVPPAPAGKRFVIDKNLQVVVADR